MILFGRKKRCKTPPKTSEKRSNPRRGQTLLVGLALAIAFLWIRPSQAQHIDYILGTGGLLTVQQAPPGIYFNNQPSYYFAGSSSALKSLNINTGLDVFLDLTTAGWTTPLTVMGANYGMNITIPLVHTNGSLDLSTDNSPFQAGRSKSALGTSSIYVEPINLGWQTPVFDAITSFGFFAPAGSYNRTGWSIPGSAAGPRCFHLAVPAIPIRNEHGRWLSSAAI